VAIRSYCDGSKTSHMSLAGFSASDDFWVDLEQGWKVLLADRTPPAPYIHMTDIVAAQKPFTEENGWTEDKRLALVNQAASYLSHRDKSAFCGFSCVVDCAARDRLIKQGASIAEPHKICSEVCLGAMMKWIAHKYVAISESEPIAVETMDFFFDQGEPFRGYFEKYARIGKKKKQLIWSLVNTIAPADMKLTPGLQVADMLAWSGTRKHSRGERTFKHLFDNLGKVVPITYAEIGEEQLRKKGFRTAI
jgi:hypothetical protein